MSAALPGYVYVDSNFKFRDGTTGKKLFVVLCDSALDNEVIVVAKTTSKTKSELTYGCFQEPFPPCFFLPVNDTTLPLDTWITLDDVFEFDKQWLESKKRITELSLQHTIDLLWCASDSMYLASWQKTALENEAKCLSGA